MRTAVITIAHGRHDHWKLQRSALTRWSHTVDRHILVSMADPWFGDDGQLPTLDVVSVSADPRGLPLARARNVGAQAALANGCELLIFLDVDCIPGPELIDTYRNAAQAAETRHMLLCGPVIYLPEPGPRGYDLARLPRYGTPHPARPAPAPGQVITGGAHELFWSLSFALTANTWQNIGGFDEAYIGYGAEDTDFGQRARRAGVGLAWVGGAEAFHQHHPTQDPPIGHLADILQNGRLFAERWGWWPMRGWLDEFEARGLIERDSALGYRAARLEAGNRRPQ
jgi:hypothetical protein